MLKTASRIACRVPAARIAAKEDPYSTIRRSPRLYQTRCGIRCTSGCAPVAIDDRQTGVNEGKVETPRAYVPFAARNLSAGVLSSSAARSKTPGVRPSITIRISFLAIGVSRARAFADPRSARVGDGAPAPRLRGGP